MSGELLPQLCAEAPLGREHLLLWTGLTWPQDIPATMFALLYRHVLGSQRIPVSNYRLLTLSLLKVQCHPVLEKRNK